MKQYLDLVNTILSKGVLKQNRTGIAAYTIAGAMIEHDMSRGFPLLTTKRMGFKSIATELEFFISGKTDKQWLKDRNCNIWNEWCNPTKVPYAHDTETRKRMSEERDLGPIYGAQWRHFGAEYQGFDHDYTDEGVDQLKSLIGTLHNNPMDRRMIVSAWNPLALSQMALPPCHYSFQVTVLENKLNLLWNQRSVDAMLGLPYNIASYGLLLHLLAKESNLQEGKLIGFLGDVHIYENHLKGAKEQLIRQPASLPKVYTEIPKNLPFGSGLIFSWNASQTQVLDYKPYSKIEFPIAV